MTSSWVAVSEYEFVDMWVVDETAIVNSSESERRVRTLDAGFKLQINEAQVSTEF